jgi:hypothetical protein
MSRSLTSVSQKTNHDSSEWLRALHPYFPEAHAANFAATADPYQVERAFGNRAIPKLAELLRFADLPDGSRAAALRVMVALTGDQCRKQEAIAEGAISSCTGICQRGVEDAASAPAEVKEHAILVLASLACAPQSQPQFAQFRTLGSLTGALQSEERSVREAAALALLNFSTSRQGTDMIVACSQPDADNCCETIRVMVNALIEPSALVSLYLISALGNICRYAEGTDLALAAGIVAKAVDMMKNAGPSGGEVPVGSPLAGLPAGTRLQSLNTVWNVGNHLRGKEELIEYGVVPAITGTLADTSRDVRRCAVGALMALSVDENGKCEIMEHSLGQLTRLLLDEYDSVRNNARITIVHASENRRARFQFVRECVQTWPGSIAQSSELVLRVFGMDAAEPLCELLAPSAGEGEDVIERVCVTICDLIDGFGDRGNDAMMSTLYITERLAACLAAKRETTRVASGEALVKLCAKHKYAVKRLKTCGVGENCPEGLVQYL